MLNLIWAMDKNYLIAGHGLAGCVLALTLLRKHVDDVQNGTLSRKDLKIYLGTYGQSKMFQFTEQ